jgi:hypothetical protein
MAETWFKSLKRLHRERKLRAELGLAVSHIERAINKNFDAIPVLVVSYNNGVYVQNTVSQLQRFGITPIIIDNCSHDPDTIQILSTIQKSGSAQVIVCNKNFGHAVGFLEPIYKLLPEVFAYTDPDIEFSSKLPGNFLSVLSQLTVEYSTFKAGFALSLTADEVLLDTMISCSQYKPFSFKKTFSVREWESQFWRMRLAHDSLEVYAAKIDTTFAVYRKSNYRGDFMDAIRVAGDYSAIHLPWFPKLDIMSDNQKRWYLNKNKSTSWVRTQRGSENCFPPRSDSRPRSDAKPPVSGCEPD